MSVLIPQRITVKKVIPKIEVLMGIKKINVRHQIPTILVHDNKPSIESTYTYVDAGYYNEEGLVADAMFYNTTSWDSLWDGGYS